jgi:hypothetical protein
MMEVITLLAYAVLWTLALAVLCGLAYVTIAIVTVTINAIDNLRTN